MAAHMARSMPVEELLARSICPVKKEFVADVGARQYVDEVKAADPAQGSARTEAASKGRRRKQVPLGTAVAASAIDK